MRSLFLVSAAILMSGTAGLQAQVSETGDLAVYSSQSQGRPTASGEIYNHSGLTAAHAELPFGSIIRVANFETGRMVDVRVNDRKGNDGRILTLSFSAAQRIGLAPHAVAPGSLMVIGQTTAVQPVARTKPPGPFSGNNLGAMFNPIEPGSDPQPKKFKPFSGFGRNSAINEAVAQPNSAPVQQKGGGLRELFSRGPGSNNLGNQNPPAAGYRPPLGAPNSPSAEHLIPMNATIPTAPPAQPPVRTAAASQAPPPAEFPYRAQFGAFRAENNAREMANSLNATGVGTTVLRSSSTGLFLVVTGGGFRTAEEAQQWINTEATRRGWRERPMVVR